MSGPRITEGRSIRFQNSVLMLLGALNGAVVVALALFVLAAPGRQGVGPGRMAAGYQGLATVAEVERRAAAGEDTRAATDLPAAVERFEGTPGAAEVRRVVDAYGRALDAWEEAGRPGPEDATTRARTRAYDLVVDTMFGSFQPLPFGLDRRHRHLVLPFLVWTVLVALANVVAAVRLRWTLSQPLALIGAAAERVASGDLDTPIEPPRAAAEFRRLARALEAMRARLVSTIERLDAQNAEMRAMLGALGDGVLMVDQAGRLVEGNASIERMVLTWPGRRPGVREGVPLRALLPELGRPLPELAEAGPQRVTLGDGHPRHLDVEVVPVGAVPGGSGRAYVVVVRDVTEAVRAEELMRDFLGMVTHELKTPLTAVQGYARLLAMGKGGELTDRQRRLVERIVEQSEVMGRMVSDLLDATRLEGGHLSLDLREQDARELVEEAVGAFQAIVTARGLDFEADVTVPAGTRVAVDRARFQQVVGNLVRNAVKFTDPPGRVGIAARVDGGELLVSVTDTGCGIPETEIPRLFEKFYQVERGDTRPRGGAGLGLFISDQLVRGMGGRIEVASRPGEGSRFTVHLPLAGEEAPT